MRRIVGLLSILLLGLFACSNMGNKTNAQIKPEQQNKTLSNNNRKIEIVIKNTKGQAILIGESIKLLDNNLNEIADISNLTTKYVEISGISDTLFNDTKDICKAFWYVRIKTSDKVGIVNGRQVFRIEKSIQDTTALINGEKLEFLTTTCLAMGVEYQGDFMDCPVDQPVILKDEKNKFNGLITVIPNDFYNKAIWNKEFSFFQLRSDGGNFDKIVAISAQESGIILSIHRRFQEGENDYDVLLKYDQGKYTAEYLNYGEIKYE